MNSSGKINVTFLPFIASAAAISEPMNPPPITLRQAAQPLVIIYSAKIDDLVSTKRKSARRAARGQKQLLEVVNRALIISHPLARRIQPSNDPSFMKCNGMPVDLAPNTFQWLVLPKPL